MKNKSLVSIYDFTKEDYLRIINLAAEFEKNPTQDILNGYMHVEIGMAVVRPAEFIILKFSHKLQES